jgi:hypothetical protein
MALAACDARIFELEEVLAEAVGFGHPKLLPAFFLKVHFIITMIPPLLLMRLPWIPCE